MERRKFIKNSALALMGMSLATGLYAWQVEPFWLEFVRKQMPIPHLPEKLVGKTLLQISDLHVGNRFDYQYLIDALQKAQKLQPDFVVYTGDFVTYETATQLEQLEAVLVHAAKGKLGTLAILGNHDYGEHWKSHEVATEVVHRLSSAGIQVLRNGKKTIEDLAFIGFDDYWGLNFNPEKAMASYNSKQATIALCHNPDVCDLDIWKGYQGWILSGHTHGGQVKPPFLKPPQLPVVNKRYVAGEIDLHDGRTLYINRALGHLIQVRFNVRPEITIFELQRK